MNMPEYLVCDKEEANNSTKKALSFTELSLLVPQLIISFFIN